MPRLSEEVRGHQAALTVELSPSPDPPSDPLSTFGPSCLTTAAVRARSVASAEDLLHRAACEGDLYVVNAMNGDRFHLTVTLQGPYHPLTCVSRASLWQTVCHTLLPAAARNDPPPTLLLEGMPLDASETETLPNNAVVVVHRGVSMDSGGPLALQRHRSRTPSQPADGGITVVEMLSDSLPPSAIAASEREMSLHSLLRPSVHNGLGGEERPQVHAARPRSKSPKGPAQNNTTAAAGQTGKPSSSAAAASVPSRRLPPRRVSTTGNTTTTIKTTAAAAAAPTSFARTNAEAAAGLGAPVVARSVDRAPATAPPQLPSKSLLSSPSEEDAYVIRTPAANVSAKPLVRMQDTGISAATVSAPSSIEAIPSLKSMNETRAPPDEDSVAGEATPVHVSFHTPPPKETTAAATAVSASAASSPTEGCVWDRSKPPPVTVILPSSSSPSHPSTAFTSPAFSQKSPPGPAQPPRQQQLLGVHSTHVSAVSADDTSSTASARLPSTPPRPAAAAASTGLSTSLLCTPFQTPDTSVTAATKCDATRELNGRETTASTTVVLPTTFTLPLPPHDNPATSQTNNTQSRTDARQAAYDTQRDVITSAAAAEQQRLLTRLQQHCRVLEAEKKKLLTARLADLREQEAASRLRALRSAQEDAAAREIDAVRACLGHRRDELLNSWLRVLHAHSDTHYAMPHTLLKELEEEGEQLSLSCMSSIASYHTQKARLQAVQQQRLMKEAEVARLRWAAHVRRCAAEEQRGCLRVVARVRPPLRRAWLPDWVLASPEAQGFNGGYAVRASPSARPHHVSSSPEASPCIEIVDPPRDVRRRYTFAAAYDGEGAASQQQQLFKEQLQPLLEHMCRTGQRVAVLAFGAVGSGKTYTLVGPPVVPPPLSTAKRKAKDALTAPNAGGSSRRSVSTIAFSTDEDEGEDVNARRGSPCGHGERGAVQGEHSLGISVAGAPAQLGITRCLDPADEAMEARVLQSVQAAEERDRRQRSSERHAREEHQWRAQAGVEMEDGLLPRAVAWLTAHLRANLASRKGTAGEPVVESVVFSMYEVYNDHIYDLLPNPPPSSSSQAASPEPEEESEGRRVRSDPSTWPRWNAGWLPPPHIKNSNPEKLTELQMELVSAERGSEREAAATVSQQQPAQPQWRVRASEVEVRSAAEVLQAVELGMQRRRSAATQRSAESSRSHLFLRFRVEVQRPAMPEKASAAAAKSTPLPTQYSEAGGGVQDTVRPKGYHFLSAALAASTEQSPAATPAGAVVPAPTSTCVTELLFTDFAGSERVELAGPAGNSLKEAQYINASLSAVADVLIALARANPSRGDAEGSAASKNAKSSSSTAPVASATALVERWGAVVSRPGVSLTRSTPVFLQPRFSKVAAGGRFRAPPSSFVEGEGVEPGLPLRRRVLALMDAHVAGQEAAQWWRSWRASSTYIPFRACKTTQLLQSALGAPCKTLVLACVRPCTVAEVVLPESMQDRRDKRVRELALALFDRQAPIMLGEVYSTLGFADRINTAAHQSDAAQRSSTTTARV